MSPRLQMPSMQWTQIDTDPKHELQQILASGKPMFQWRRRQVNRNN